VTSPWPQIESPVGLIVLRWIIGMVLVLGLLGCVVKGANNPPDPYVASPSGSSHRVALPDFGETRITVRTGEQVLSWCLLLAATAAQRARGLMTVTDPTLGGYDGMLFRYDSDTDEMFWMRNTPMPLSIAFVSSTGALVSAVDMQPCADSPDCQTYPAAAPYRIAIEVPQGRISALGIAPGATVTDERAACGS
jgi:uncharacterized membrane protein (UPF0127 family)